MRLPVPSDTRLVLMPQANNATGVLKTTNLGLLFNKFVFAWSDNWTTEEKTNREKVNLKADFIKKVKENSTYSTANKELVSSVQSRQKAMLQALQASGWYVEPFEATTDSRLIIGLGGTSVIETGMTLHPLYGFPYLPGSGLKGLARAHAEIAIEHEPTEEEFRKELREIFGSEYKDRHATNNRQGRVFFMDGLPTTFPKLDLDIMNPHYSKYYQGEKDSKGNLIPPADYLNPIPVTFLAVAQDQKFSFAVCSRDEALAEKAKSWLICGLTDLGAGGKTNVGYGYFKVDESHRFSPTDDPGMHQQPEGPKPKSEKWEDAPLTWDPSRGVVKTEREGRKAETEPGKGLLLVPESLRNRLEKRKTVKAKVTVEHIGGKAFRIVKIE